MLQLKYIILLWIIALIFFTFYCIYRLANMSFKPINNFVNITNPLTQPTSQNLIKYINNIAANDKITNIPSCANIYDDNIAVRSLGYNNCSTANADYFARNLDINQKYGNVYTLAQLCPISTKSDAYMNCMKQLLNKFNTNANILDSVNIDMTNLVNKRLSDRLDVLDNIDISLNSYLYSQSQLDFHDKMISGEPINPTPEQIIGNVNYYYQNKYGNKSSFNNITEHFASNLEIYNIDPYIETYFFGTYTPIKGQYLAFNNLTVSLNYILDKAQIIPLKLQSQSQQSQQSQSQAVKKIFLSIIDNNTNAQIVYTVNNIGFYLQYKNVIKIHLVKQTINTVQPADAQILQQLLTTLGITVPNQLIMTIDAFTSTEKITRKTYKLLNSNMNTIMVLAKN